MKFAHTLSRFTGSPWFLREDALSNIARLLESRVNSNAPHAGMYDDEDRKEKPDETTEDAARAGVALISVTGVLGKRLSSMETACGGCDYDAITSKLELALANPRMRSVVMLYDSPGGTAVGCHEAHERIAALCAASEKRVVAYTDTECASAAYYLASACEAIFATPTAIVGSTGVKMVLRDESEKLAQAGVKFHVFKSGSMKDIGASYRAPSEDEAKVLQARCDAFGAQFRADVLDQRPGVKSEAFDTALTYSGGDAVALGLVDEIVSGLDALLEQLAAR